MLRRTFLVLLGLGVLPVGIARAVVTSVSADVQSSVQSFEADMLDASDEAAESFGPDSGVELPITSLARLDAVTSAEFVEAAGVAVADVLNLTASPLGRNPQEFGLEADCFSSNPTTRYTLLSTATERRVARITTEELGPEVAGLQTIQSAFFPSGAIFAWSMDPSRDLSDLFAVLTISIRRLGLNADGTDGGATEVLRESVTLRGGPGGSFAVASSSGIQIVTATVQSLPAIDIALPGDLASLESNQAVIIPEFQQLNYEYLASPDEDFVLEATVVVEAGNVPDGTGVAAVFGRGFETAAGVLLLAFSEPAAKEAVARINRAIESPTTLPRSRAPCGGFGFELLAPAAFSMFCLTSPNARRRLSRRVGARYARLRPPLNPGPPATAWRAAE